MLSLVSVVSWAVVWESGLARAAAIKSQTCHGFIVGWMKLLYILQPHLGLIYSLNADVFRKSNVPELRNIP